MSAALESLPLCSSALTPPETGRQMRTTGAGRLTKNENDHAHEANTRTDSGVVLSFGKQPAPLPKSRQFVGFPKHDDTKNSFFDEQSRNVYENKGNADKMTC